MPKVSEEHLNARRQQILMAAYRSFGNKGFHGTTMRDICREAGLSAGAVYNYFKSKDDIVEALAECGRQNTRAFIESVDGPGRAPEALGRIVATLVPMLDNPKFQKSSRFDVRLWGEAVHTPRLRKLCRQGCGSASDPFVDIVRRGQERGEIDGSLDAKAAGRVLLALLLGLQVQKAIDPGMRAGTCAAVAESLLTGSFVAKER